MSKSTKSAVFTTKPERLWGFFYLILQLFAFPYILAYGNTLLPVPLSKSWLNILYFCLNFIFTCFIFRKLLKRSLVQTGKDTGRFFVTTLAGFGMYYACNVVLNIVIRLVTSDYTNLNDGNLTQQFQDNFAIMAICTALLVPVAEELLYRGLVFGSLCNKKPWMAYTISAILFSVIHIMGYLSKYSAPHLLVAFVQYLPAGFALAWAYHKSRSIFSPILIHATINTLGILALR